MRDADRVWTHVSDDQAAGRACVMCGRPTDEPGWNGVVVGQAPGGTPVYACSGGGRAVEGDPMGRTSPAVSGPPGRICAEQAAAVVPDSLEGLDP